MDDALQPWIYLIKAREDAGKSETDVATEAGISLAYYSDIERGHRRCVKNAALLARIAKAVAVRPSDLSDSRPGGRGYRNTVKATVPSELAS